MPRVGNTSGVFRRGMITVASIGTSPILRPTLYAVRHVVPANGWVTGMGVLAGTDEPSTELLRAQLALWGGLSSDSTSLRFRSTTLTLSRTQAWRTWSSVARVDKDAVVWTGIWGQANDLVAGLVSCASSGRLHYYGESNRLPGGVPGDIAPDETFVGEAAPINSYFDYLANVAPTTGAVTSPASGAVGTSTTATIAGTTPHAGGDGAYDYSQAIQLQVYDAATNLPVYDQILTTTSSERSADSFSRAVDVTSGKSYYTRFRHQDSWGVWAPYSANRRFSVAAVPDAPTPVSPLVKLDQRSGYEYRVVHNHPEGRPANGIHIQVFNAGGTAKLYDTDEHNHTSEVAAGATLVTPWSSVAAWGGGHPTLSWATGYSWRARVRDTLGVWSNWSPLSGGAFATNSTPTAPTRLIPKDGSSTGDREFRASVSDPNGDVVTAAQMELVRVSTGAVVTGYPRAMTITGGIAVYTVPEADLVARQLYRWRARATDGLASGYGPWSGYAQFTFAAAATVRLLTPSQNGRINMIAEPSAEYDAAVPWWQIVNPDATGANSIVREQTDDAAYGEWRWLCVRANAALAAPYMQSPLLPVDQLERYLAQIHLKKLPLDEMTTQIPALTSLLEVLCYNAAGTLVGTVSPAGVGSANNTDPAPYWQRYGGPVWPSDETSAPRFPVGTTQARVRITPVSGSTTGRVAVDALSFEVMPDATTGSFAGQHYSDSSFFGYADPDTDGYGAFSGEWVGDEGSSESDVLAALQDPATNHVMYSYSHPSGLAINATRVIVQRLEYEGRWRWRPHHDSGYRAPASTPTVTLPDYLFRNELRYRIKVVCRDSQGINGESEWVSFVARFEGPPEIPIFSYQADADRGTITVSFESTGLATEEFGGIEVGRSAEDEPMRVVAVVRDAGASSYVYHFPVSGTQYRFHVRQVRLVGPEQIEGRWRTVDATVDYEGFNFLKHAHRPEEYVVFQHSSGLGPNQSRDAAGEGYAPWGSEVPVHLFSEARFRSDTTSFLLFPHHPQSPSERLRILKAWERERPPLCLMAQQPEPEKVFVALLGSVRFPREGRLVRCELDWQQTAYQEPSPYDLEGAVEDLRAADLGLAT